jgi:membrane-bound serine protease (ClpP class)
MRKNKRGLNSKKKYFMLCILFSAFLILLPQLDAPLLNAQTLEGPVIIAEFDVPVDAGSSLFMENVVQQAIDQKASAIVINMNTPGGLLSDMTNIISSISDANQSGIPTYTYVSPNGLAASAGSYIAMACNKIIMGPGCAIGPSTPIVVGGTPLEQNHTQNAMLSLLVGLAEKWGRNTTAAALMVETNLAFSTGQALKYHVIDGTASSLSEALSDLGLTGEQVTISESWYQQFLSAISNPTLDGILMLVGVMAIYLDLQHGTILMTVIGLIAIAMGLAGAEIISASLLGFVLIGIAGFLIVLELKIGHGLAILTGTLVGVAGIYYLANGLSYSPSPFTLIIKLSLVGVVGLGVVLALYFRLYITPIRHRKSLTGPEAFIDKVGVAVSDIKPDGEAKVKGEIWKARSRSGDIIKGQNVKVVSAEGITLIVEATKDHPNTV